MYTVKYKPRKGGNATYWDMNPSDQSLVLNQLERLMIEVAERSISKDILDQNLTAIWTAPGAGLGYSPLHNSENTIASVVGGILKNHRTGSRDLTDKNCEKIEAITEMITNGIQQGHFPKFKIEQIKFVKHDDIKPSTLFSDKLFDIQ